ncbi:MAG: 3,4-dihydroxy-9,10-secoandrosta,3,5(10)-triene-9,17-dione 4,5-dioxygenase [Pseudonocardiales bacterium]|nr:3,4-dihydroxy-9,10-secoandrosta,3,5(10)-triene-9,17-dione 4,5-dioxygenase [Pseudonocardiales bacterium]MDQ1734035.1 3,4-dihydroxy-9,10-secoandrosta,3,5(10)-triene-9,17-dione 4,5-dioxygenase [Pseudonocardiales bacterium]
MDIHSLGFVRLESTVVEQWRSFATDVLGALVTDGPDGSLHLRLDDRPVRVAIVPGERDRLIGAAFEVRDRLALEAAVAELEAAGVAVKEGSTDEAAARRVEKFVAFDDPNGNPIELFFSQSVDGLDVQLPHGGAFLTGALGVGHVVLPSADIEAAFDFYTKVLGFRHRDSMAITFPNGMQVRLRFLGCNARHHSVALTQTQSEQGMRHMMLEADSIKTFGRTYARAREAGALKTEMGQHSNDEVLSFYLNCPGGFEIEYGVHGRHVDDATWLTRDLTALSYWGYWPAAKLEPTA